MRLIAPYKILLAGLLTLLPSITVFPQKGSNSGLQPTSKAPSLVPGELAEENDYFRVLRAELQPESGFRPNQRMRDIIIVAMGEGLQLTTDGNASPISLKDGGVQFLARGGGSAIHNSGKSLPQLCVVELKQHWDPEVQPCSQLGKCVHPIKMGDASLGETTSLFTNGFVTANRHRIDRGGTLDTSYFSSRGKDHLLLIALSELQANFDGVEETIQRGQSYTSEATSVEVNAQNTEAQWIMIRVQTPKK